MRKIFAVSLGCPKNLADSEEALSAFRERGWAVVPEGAGRADAVFLNTCGFLQAAIAEAEGEIARLVALKRAGKVKKVAVGGCLVQRLGVEKLALKFPGVDVFAGVADTARLAELLECGESALGPLPSELCAPQGRLRLTLPHTAYLKIADGCDNRCSYCTIPSIRGPFRSKPVPAVLDEARALAASGAKEIILIAQDTTSYGCDLPGRPSLAGLLEKLARVGAVRWLRLMYARPEKITPELARVMAREKKVCKYLDVPLQHCRARVLHAMNRRYGQELIEEKLSLLRRRMPEIAVRTTFICGFPGETAADAAALERFVLRAEFSSVGVFPYSREPGTPAAALKGAVAPAARKRRAARVMRAQSIVADRRNNALVGREVEVLMDSPRFGRTYMDAPEIDGFVEVKSRRALAPGELIKVKITEARGYARKGECNE